MFRSLVVLVGAAAAAAGPPDSANARELIIGGNDAPAASWPSMAAIFPAADSDYLRTFCGGTLIDPQWVLTAAHCLVDPTVDQPAEIDVALGVTNLATDAGPRRDVDQIVRHPGWADDDTFTDDVALLHLSAPAAIGTAVAPIDIVSPIRPDLWDAGSPAEIVGWGETGSGLATDLQQASIAMISDSLCTTLLGSGPLPVFVASSMVCAGNLAGGVDACQGDSGGPLTVTESLGPRRLAGAVSWGVGCGSPNVPGVYSRLDTYRAFVFGPSGLDISAPAAPTAVEAVQANEAGTMASVSWTPGAGGGRTIADYRVRVLNNGVEAGHVLVPGTQSQISFGGFAFNPATTTFTVAAAHGAGASPESAPAGLGPLPPPVNETPPSVAGTARRGETLLAGGGGWRFISSPVAIQWLRCDTGGGNCIDIPGATNGGLTLQQADVGHRIRVRETATNSAQTTFAVSPPTEVVVPPPPTLVAAPTVAGVAEVGRILTAQPGTWQDLDRSDFQWRSCHAQLGCSDIAGGTASTLTVTGDLLGRIVSVTVTAVNTGGATTATSVPTPAVVWPTVATPDPLRITALRRPVVAQTRRGVVTVHLRVRVEAGAVVSARVLDHRGKPRRLNQALSRISGRRGKPRSGGLTSTVGPSGAADLVLVFGGRASGVLRGGRVVLVATRASGERAGLPVPFRARF